MNLRSLEMTDLHLLSDEQKQTIYKGMSLPGKTAVCTDGFSIDWIGGVSEVCKGTGELWLVQIGRGGPSSWKCLKDFFKTCLKDYYRVQCYVFPDGDKTRNMIERLGMVKECTLTSFFNGFDSDLYHIDGGLKCPR